MNRLNDILIRPALPMDDVKTIARLLYLTDPYIYPYLSSDPTDGIWVDFIGKALKNPCHVHSARNIMLAISDNSVVGLICAYLPSDKVFLQPAENSILPKYVAVWEGYYQHAAQSVANLYISNLCVDPDWRRMGIGKALLNALIAQHPLEPISLDVLADNLPAIALYEKSGFIIQSSYNGFLGVSSRTVKCLSMLRSPSSVP